MIKIKIEATNLFSEKEGNEIDSVEIIDSSINSDATIDEYFNMFFRAMQGISFSKDSLDEYIKEYIELEIS